MLTNRRLVILDGADRQPSEVRLPLPAGDLARVDAVQVTDGMLVSFISGYRRLDGVTNAPQVVVLVDGAGHVQELAHDFPPLFEHKDWWISPALHALVALPELLADTGLLPDDGASRYAPLLRARPAEVWCAAIVGAPRQPHAPGQPGLVPGWPVAGYAGPAIADGSAAGRTQGTPAGGIARAGVT